MHQLQFVAHQLNRKLCAVSGAERHGHNQRHAWLHVLGRGVSGDETRLHGAARLLRGRSRCRRNLVRNTDSDATATSELKLVSPSTNSSFSSSKSWSFF